MAVNATRKASIFLYIVTFLLIYMPSFFSNNIINYLMPFLYGGVTLFLTRKTPKGDKFAKNYKRLMFSLIVATIYFCLRAMFAGTSLTDLVHLRIVQSLQFIVSIMGIYNINCHLTSIGYPEEEKVKFLLNVCMIQFLFVLLMIVFPDLRSILLDRFYQNGEGNVWTISKRVYGIMMNYTFAGAVFHGIMVVVAYCYGLKENKKFFIYIPMLLLMILLNGRTGLFVSVIGVIICTFVLLSRKNILRILKYASITIVSFILVFQGLRIVFPSTYAFVIKGIDDAMSIFIGEEKTGNVSILSSNFSNNLNLGSFIIGNGHRIQNSGDIPEGVEFDYSYSDAGFLNDMFMGGLPYMLLLYIPTIILILTRKSGSKKDLALSLFFLATIVICNIKGEVFRSSMIMSTIIFIKAAIEQSIYPVGLEKELNNG